MPYYSDMASILKYRLANRHISNESNTCCFNRCFLRDEFARTIDENIPGRRLLHHVLQPLHSSQAMVTFCLFGLGCCSRYSPSGSLDAAAPSPDIAIEASKHLPRCRSCSTITDNENDDTLRLNHSDWIMSGLEHPNSLSLQVG